MLDPQCSQALYGRAMLAMSRGASVEAIRDLERALEADPNRIEARRYLAIAWPGRATGSVRQRKSTRCLEREPRSARTLYAVACVVARAYENGRSREVRDQAIDLLRRAFTEGADRAKAALDPDLASIRHLPVFQKLVSQLTSSEPAGPLPL